MYYTVFVMFIEVAEYWNICLTSRNKHYIYVTKSQILEKNVMFDFYADHATSVLIVFPGISWIKGNAECLPVQSNTYDAYTIAFGIRNCTHVDKVCALFVSMIAGTLLFNAKSITTYMAVSIPN